MNFVLLPLTPNPGGSGFFCVCAVWLQFAFCRKEFSDQVRLALHRGSLARGTAGPFAKKKGFCCIGAHFSWKISMKTAGKPFPAILGKFAASFFFSSSIFGRVVGVNWLFFIWIFYAGFVFYLAMGPYCPFRN